MARNGSGTMSVPYNDFVSGQTISSAQMDANFATIVAEITNSVPRDGQAAPTANLPMGGFYFTGMGSGLLASDSASLGQVAANAYVWCGTAGGTADALTLTPSPAHSVYSAGKIFRFLAGATNTGAATVNVSGLGAKNIQNNGAALTAGMIENGKLYEIIYDGTQFQIAKHFNPVGMFAPLANPTFTGTTTTAALSATTGAFSGDFAIATNKFTVAAATGNTVVAGTLDVAGVGTLGSSPASNDSSLKMATTAFVNPANSQAADGYVKLASGVIIQWGTSGGVNGGASVGVTFPIAFPTNVFVVTANGVGAGASGSAASIGIAKTTSGATLYNWGSINLTSGVMWTAIGN